MTQESTVLMRLVPGSHSHPTQGAVPLTAFGLKTQQYWVPWVKQVPKEREWVLGDPKPTNTMKVALWTKERAEQTQGGLKAWGLEFWGLPLPTAGHKRGTEHHLHLVPRRENALGRA